MIKKIIILLLSSNLIAANSATELDDSFNKELSLNEKRMAYISTAIGALCLAEDVGKTAVLSLPEGSHPIIKSSVFIPTVLTVLAIEVLIWQETDMINYYKKHKWLLYLSGGTTALLCTTLAAYGLILGVKGASL